MNIKGPILLFDGDCNLCDSMVNFVLRHDTSKEIMFSALQSDTGRSLIELCGLTPGYHKSVVYIRKNKYFIQSSAVLNIFKDLGGWWSLFYGFIIIPAFIRDFFYFIIAGTRYSVFGKRGNCALSEN
jgi:predicted DCC family thiol-disulfide oxidoreductase YuxK